MFTLPEYEGPCTLERAVAIAAMAHEGMRDKAGAPYILHSLRVMAAQGSDEARMVAALHDVVEDTSIGFDELATKAKLPVPVSTVLDATDTAALCAVDPE